MDILAHTLWTTAIAKGANKLGEKSNSEKEKAACVNVAWAAFFGIFPDLFAFTIPFSILFYNILTGVSGVSNFLQRSHTSVEGGLSPGFNVAHELYQYSHSLVVFAVVFLIVWFIYKRPRYELLGWALHILIDIPSHSLSFFPTPFLFPISNYYFPYGISWGNYWYMVINYSSLLVVWLCILFKRDRSRLGASTQTL